MSATSLHRWVIFDADNTLWYLEPLYDEARNEMATYVASLCRKRLTTISNFQKKRDVKLEKIYGYSAARFARSFEDTILSFVPKASTDQIRHVRRIAEQVFARKANMVEDAEVVLRSLREAGFRLGLLTAGEAWVQQKRINDFHLQGIFHDIQVVESKNKDTFVTFCEKHKIDRRTCYVIGDSLSSDIGPASEAGLRPIFVPQHNWKDVEGRATVDPKRFKRVKRLRDVLRVLKVPAIDLRPSFEPIISCYGIFEGGGARGLAHVGALKACEERRIQFRGYEIAAINN